MYVFPTRSIHFVEAGPADQRLDLTLCDDWPPDASQRVWTDLARIPGVQIAVAATAEMQHPIAIDVTLAPASPTGLSINMPAHPAIGRAFFRIDVTAGAVQRLAVLRVAIHHRVATIDVPYGDARVLAGSSDLVLTVLATFDDHESWDVSEHRFLAFASDHPEIASVDATGRVTGVAASATVATITVSVAGAPNVPARRVRITVETLAQRVARNDLATRALRAPAGADRRLYLVAEAYTDPQRFDEHATKIAHHIFDSEANSPFRWFKQRFAVTAVFTRSLQRGISIGPPLGRNQQTNLSLPLDAALLPAPPAGHDRFDGTQFHDPARPSAFGLMYGGRLGDPANPIANALQLQQAGTSELAWLASREPRAVVVDPRRIGPLRDAGGALVDPRTGFVRSITALLAAVHLPLGPDDRVAIVIDDQLRGGTRLGVVGLEPRPNPFVTLSIGDPNGFDGVAPIANTQLLSRTPQREVFRDNAVASSIVHELGHTYGLGDEYEEEPGAPPTPFPQTPANRLALEEYDNLQLASDVAQGGSVHLDRLKWTVSRSDKAAAILGHGLTTSPSLFDLTLAGPASGWKRDEIVLLRTSYRRPRPLAPDGSVDPLEPRIREIKAQVTATTGSKMTVLLIDVVPTGMSVSDFTVVTRPRSTDGQRIVHVIDPAVEDHLTQTLRNAFPRHVSNDPGHAGIPPNIPHYKFPKHAVDTLGLYQGAHYHAFGVLRPAGRCKLRAAAIYANDPATRLDQFKEVWAFCFVCKLIIVDRVDPSMHGKLDDEYPKDC